MADWVLIFQAFVSPTVYAPPVVIQDFQNQQLCERAAESLAGSIKLANFNCLRIEKQVVTYE